MRAIPQEARPFNDLAFYLPGTIMRGVLLITGSLDSNGNLLDLESRALPIKLLPYFARFVSGKTRRDLETANSPI